MCAFLYLVIDRGKSVAEDLIVVHEQKTHNFSRTWLVVLRTKSLGQSIQYVRTDSHFLARGS